MSDNSAILTLPYIQPSQAQKHVTHNEALATLDVLVQLSVAGFDAVTPPASPDEGEVHALGLTPTGVWAGQGMALATWRDGIWHFITPLAGWRAYGVATGELRIWDGSAWVLPVAGTDNIAGVGINTTHDVTNRLSVRADATLLSHDGAGHQLKLNKATAGDTASLLFQSAFGGHAEMGLSGSIDFAIKVSDDATTWREALRIDAASGNIGIGVAAPEDSLHLGGNILFGNTGALKWDDTTGAAQSVLRVDGGDNVTIRGAGGVRALEVEDNAGGIVFVIKDDGNVGIGVNSPALKFFLREDADAIASVIENTHAGLSTRILDLRAGRAGNPAFDFARFSSGGTADMEFRFSGDGNGTCDGAWSGGGADYAEYFEWADGNPGAEDRRGLAVVLEGDRIRQARPGEDPIGVISGNPGVVGDAAALRWKGKYLRDDFGTFLLEDYDAVSWVGPPAKADEDGQAVSREITHSYDVKAVPRDVDVPPDAIRETLQRRVPNPGYDPARAYIARSERAEWDMVGLVGKLRLRKGQVTGAGWIRMRGISDQVEEWLVR